jgi:hypothetical protein
MKQLVEFKPVFIEGKSIRLYPSFVILSFSFPNLKRKKKMKEKSKKKREKRKKNLSSFISLLLSYYYLSFPLPLISPIFPHFSCRREARNPTNRRS